MQDDRPSARTWMSDATRDTIAKLIHMDPDHPAFIYVCSALFRAKHREGLNLDDPKVRDAVIAKGKRAYERTKEATQAAERDNWIYYVRVGDLIKIGTAENVRTRLNAYPPGAELLAVENGSYRREAELLERFRKHLVARNEWFRPAPELMRYIASVRDQALIDRVLAKRRGGRRPTTA